MVEKIWSCRILCCERTRGYVFKKSRKVKKIRDTNAYKFHICRGSKLYPRLGFNRRTYVASTSILSILRPYSSKSFQRETPREIMLFKGSRVRERVRPFERQQRNFYHRNGGEWKSTFRARFSRIYSRDSGWNNCVGNRYLDDFFPDRKFLSHILNIVVIFQSQ